MPSPIAGQGTTPPSDSPEVRPAPRSRRRLLGEILVAHGVISPEQLEEVLSRRQHDDATRIGRLLVDVGLVTEVSLAEAIADQLRLPTADPGAIEVAPRVLALVPRDLALKHRVLPWMAMGRELLLVTADATDVDALDAIAFKTGLRVKPLVAPESDLMAAIDRWYGPDEIAVVGDAEGVDLATQLAVVDQADGDTAAVLEEDLARAASAAPVIALVNSILADAIRVGASDIHIEPQQKGVTLRYRIDGLLRQIITMPKRSQAKVVSRIKIAAHMDIAERRKPQDGRTRVVVGGSGFDLRISTLPVAEGEKVVIRILPQDRARLSIGALGLTDGSLAEFVALLGRPQGLILVTGPTGSGKTSTLYAALNHLHDETKNIVTIEDPIEYRLNGINQMAVNEKAGLTFASGLRSILRQDPDVVMVGEIRDAETAAGAFQAAQTGHLVLTTLHTNDAPSALTRLVDIGVPAYLVAASVLAVQAQRLVRRRCTCATSGTAGATPQVGCPTCGFTGYRGRVAVHELMPVTSRIRTAMLTHRTSDAVREAARLAGMRTMFEDGQRKAAAGLTTMEEVLRVVPPLEVDEGPAAEEAPPQAARVLPFGAW